MADRMDIGGIKIQLKRKLDFESEPKKIPKLVDPLKIIHSLHTIKDTSDWTPTQKRDVISHSIWNNNESIMATVKIYIAIRTVYHGDDILSFMFSTAKREDNGYYNISRNSLLSLLFNGITTTAIGDNILVSCDLVVKTFCDVYNDMIKFSLIDVGGIFGNSFNISRKELNRANDFKVLNAIFGE